MKAQPASFRIAPGSADSVGLATVSTWVNGAGFKPAAVSEFLAAADYFIVAQALTLGYTVVTHETPDPASRKRVKIPDACSALASHGSARSRGCVARELGFRD
jgi:hypothetical protein